MSSGRRKRTVDEKPGSSKKLALIVEGDDEDNDDFVENSTTSNALVASEDEDDDLDDLDEAKESVWKCVPCNKEFKTKRTLNDHKGVYHSDKKKDFPCTFPNCTKTFKTKRILAVHLLTHQKGEFPCDECTFVANTKDTLSTHKYQKHSTTELIFKCVKCDLAYGTAIKLRNHESNTKHPELARFVPNPDSNIMIGSQQSQPLSGVGHENEERKSYDLTTVSKEAWVKDAVAVLIMNIWKKNDLKQLKTALTVGFQTASFNYTRMKCLLTPAANQKLTVNHLTDDPSSFYITGEEAKDIANTCLTIAQLLLDMKFKFNQFTKMNQLDINNWNQIFFQKFFASNALKLILESIDVYTVRKGTPDGFSMYYRNREWISKPPEPTAGHIYAAYFNWFGELYLYIGINESSTSDKEILAICHTKKPEEDNTALGLFIQEQMKKFPDTKFPEIQGKRLVYCARTSTRRQLESACIISALFGSEEDIFLDEEHKGKFKLLNKRVDIEELTQPFLQATRYMTFKLFNKRLNITHDGDYTPHVNTTTVEECFKNVNRMH